MELKKIIFTTLVLLLGMISAYGQEVGFKGHLLYGQHVPVDSDFDEVYGSSGTFGFQGLIGLDNVYFLGRYLRLTADGEPVTSGIPRGATTKWKQDLYFLGLRAYNSGEVLSLFATAAYVRSAFNETFRLSSADLGVIRDEYDSSGNGFMLGLGASANIWIISIEGAAEYVHMIAENGNGLSDNNVNVGGFLFTLGLGVQLKGI